MIIKLVLKLEVIFILRKLFILFSKLCLSLFYNPKYLKGKYFDNGAVMGYKKTWGFLFMQKVVGYNRNVPWPVSFRTEISNWKNIEFDVNDIQNFWHFGCYFQNFNGKIIVGSGTYIAPNVGLITANHNLGNLDIHDSSEAIKIGKNCWIGMNSVILPGVILGDNTIVGAGATVTKSFPEGNCIIGGVPAKKIRNLSVKLIDGKIYNDK